MLPDLTTLQWLAYCLVGLLVGLHFGTRRAWTLHLRQYPLATSMSSSDWWNTPDPFCITVASIFAWPALLVILSFKGPVSRVLLRPPPEVRARIAAKREEELLAGTGLESALDSE